MGIFNQIEDALGGPANLQNNRFVRETSFPGNTQNEVPFQARTNPARRQRQGENAPTRKTKIIEGEKGAEEPRMLRPGEKRQQRQKPSQRQPQGEGVKPLASELKKFDKASLRKTLTSIQGQSPDKKVFGSNLTVGEAREVIKKELQRR